ncbi:MULTISPECIES: hypothetical protein [Nocardiopsis]|uniref:Uncharacterized protein n=1 Tax=Nocardiopsis changdeensis TaxID=2831969 RepID=A0ABX8BUL9_9ACTN|nr:MULTISPECIES: hypothetical protein [Nocardiopsis]QUX24899.1 hypothetical protein KGD84_11895 [Nocardiopsis changdeensis]QYX35285.1 hypothetical protein K1J57_21340 [Nocardiopsis sp. MT53]
MAVQKEKIPLDESWLRGRKPTGMADLDAARPVALELLNRRRFDAAARLCTELLASGAGFMREAGEEGDRMRRLLKACRDAARARVGAQGAVPRARRGGEPSRQRKRAQQRVNGGAPSRENAGGAASPKVVMPSGDDAAFPRVRWLIKRDPATALSLCDRVLADLRRMPEAEGREQTLARWTRLRRYAENETRRRSRSRK